MTLDPDDHTLVLYSHGTVLRTYKVALGRATGKKEQHKADLAAGTELRQQVLPVGTIFPTL